MIWLVITDTKPKLYPFNQVKLMQDKFIMIFRSEAVKVNKATNCRVEAWCGSLLCQLTVKVPEHAITVY